MRGVFQIVAAAALALPGAAYAEGCPVTVDAKFEKSLGQARAWLNDDEPMYQPAWISKLGETVSYVIVDRTVKWNGKSYDNIGIERLRFRLQGVQRSSDGAYPAVVRQAFDAEYAGSRCASGNGEECTAAGPFATGVGSLVAASLSEGDLYVRDSAYGPGVAVVKSDYEMDGEPAFLICEYQPAE